MLSSKRSNSPQKSSKGQSSLHFGIITEAYPNGTARARIEDMDGMVTMPLAVLHQNSSADQIDYWMPQEGQRVALILDEKGEQGAILGAPYTQANLPPVQDLNLLYIRHGETIITIDKSTNTVEIEGATQITVKATRIDFNPS